MLYYSFAKCYFWGKLCKVHMASLLIILYNVQLLEYKIQLKINDSELNLDFRYKIQIFLLLNRSYLHTKKLSIFFYLTHVNICKCVDCVIAQDTEFRESTTFTAISKQDCTLSPRETLHNHNSEKLPQWRQVRAYHSRHKKNM